jgi:hypothetical protein
MLKRGIQTIAYFPAALQAHLAAPCPKVNPRMAPQASLPSTVQSPESCASHWSQSWPQTQTQVWHCLLMQACTCHTHGQPPCAEQCNPTPLSNVVQDSGLLHVLCHGCFTPCVPVLRL